MSVGHRHCAHRPERYYADPEIAQLFKGNYCLWRKFASGIDCATGCRVIDVKCPWERGVRSGLDYFLKGQTEGWTSIFQIGNLARKWQDCLLSVLKDEIKAVLCVQHEKLTENPEPEIQKLELFARVNGIDRSVLDREINTFKGDIQNGHAPDQYISPRGITKEEIAIIKERAAEALEMTGYGPY